MSLKILITFDSANEQRQTFIILKGMADSYFQGVFRQILDLKSVRTITMETGE